MLSWFCSFVVMLLASVVASAAHAQSPVNRALVGCWERGTKDTQTDTDGVTWHTIDSVTLCFRDDGRFVRTEVSGGCGVNGGGHYELWGNTLILNGQPIPFRIARLGTQLTILHGGEPVAFARRCAEADGPEKCPCLLEKIGD